MIGASDLDSLVTLQQNAQRSTLPQTICAICKNYIIKCKSFSHLYGDGQDEEEEIMAVMCSVVEDDEYSKLLNQ